ncbi:MAG: FAD-dependent oxidoreductase, partial [Bdellovibrionales bacterium]|nr:FAD-dependent oxidoreductase [Bdellovibrionales bacterium]
MKGLSAIDLIQRDLVLIGGGHSHVQVILNFAMRPLKGVRVTLISDQIYAPYSGMFPAYLAGIYSFADIHFDLSRICKNAGVRFLQAKVTGLDYQKKTIFLKKRPPLSFDVASVNVGSEPDTSILKGDKDKLILMKPIYRFIGLWDEFIREMNQSELKPLHIAMVGGGASGIEVALVIKKRFADKIESFHLFQSQSELLVGHNKRVKQLFEKELEANKIELHLNSRVVELIEGGLKCSNGETYLADKIFWATRAAAKDWFAGSNLPTDQKGFLQVDDSLQVRNCQDLFGAGDCIQFAEQELPKSGVFAVREGPILAHNLRSRILNQGSSLIPYRPQKRSLALISRGERSAVASYGPWSFEGEWVWRWKDYIDTKFMARFRLDSPLQTGMNSLAMAPLEYDFLEEKDLDIEGKLHSCGGCGAKLGPEILSEVLASVVQEQNQMVQVGLQDGEDGA